MADTSYVGDQRFWRMSRQMPPSAYTLGWNILLTNLRKECVRNKVKVQTLKSTSYLPYCGGFVGVLLSKLNC